MPGDGGSRFPADEPLRLQSILIAPERRVAVINRQTVSEGDSVDGATVTSIETYEVHLEGEDGSFIISLSGEPVKSPAEDDTADSK